MAKTLTGRMCTKTTGEFKWKRHRFSRSTNWAQVFYSSLIFGSIDTSSRRMNTCDIAHTSFMNIPVSLENELH